MPEAPQYPLFEKLCDWYFLKLSYKQTQLGYRKNSKEAILFDMEREHNLIELWRELRHETYKPGGYNTFTVYEPKERLISAPKLRDKVVEYAAHRILRDEYLPVYIKDSYACMEDKGSHKAVETVQRYMRLCQWEHGGGWILKLDVKKFFYTIDRAVLKGLLRKRIKDEKFLRVLDSVIDSPPGDVGVPLGNATSQDFANITLNEVDQMAKRWLGLKWYVRYMDDIIAVFPAKDEAQTARDKIIGFIRERLHMEPHEKKTKIFPLSQGVNAYGFKIWTTHTQVREDSKRAMKRRIKEMARKVKAGEMTAHDARQSVNSWLGHARHSNSYNLSKKLFGKYRFLKVEHPNYYFGRRKKPHEAQ